MSVEQRQTGEDLERELARAPRGRERFPPPEAFREQALIKDWRSTRRPSATSQASGPSRPRAARLVQPREQALDDSNAPFYKWFEGGTLNVSYNCLDRHVEAGSGDRVAFHWRGEEGEEREITYAELLATSSASPTR